MDVRILGQLEVESAGRRMLGELLSDMASLETALLVAQRQGAVTLARREESSLARFREAAGVSGDAG